MRFPLRSITALSLAALAMALAPSPSCRAQAQQTATLTPSAISPEEDDIVELSPFEVNATKDDGYIAANSLSGTGYDMELMNLPRPIDVLTSEFLDDMGVWDAADALRYAGSLSDDGNGSPDKDLSFYSRGFATSIGMRNGYRTYVPSDPLFMDRMEVLKGPSSTFAGAVGPGGAISIGTKRPPARPSNQAGFRFGSYGSYRVEAASGGPLGENQKFRYFAGVATQRIGSQIDFAEAERRVFGGTFAYHFTRDSKLSLDLQWMNTRGVQSVPPVYQFIREHEKGWVPNIRREFNKAGPDATSDLTQRQAILEFTQTLGKHWYLRTAASIGDHNDERINMSNANRDVTVTQLPDGGELRTVTRSPTYMKTDYTRYFFHGSLLAKYEFWGINYTGLASVDYYRTADSFKGEWLLPTASAMSPLNIDSTNRADFAILPVSKFTEARRLTTSDDEEREFMVSNVFGLFKNSLFVFQAFRYAESEFDSKDPARASYEASGPGHGNASSYGVLYRVLPQLSAFVSYGETYQPQFGATYEGDPFKPIRGNGWDAGIKFRTNKDRLSGSVVGFTTERSGYLQPDPDNSTYNRQSGTDESKGVEFTLTGKIAKWWNMSGNYTYTDNKIVKDDYRPHWVGKPQVNVPRHGANIRNTFTLFRGLKLGVSMRHVGTRRGMTEQSPANPEYDYYRSPAYTCLDADIQYKTKIAGRNITAQLNVYNLLNHDYKASWSNYGAPINFTASVKLTF